MAVVVVAPAPQGVVGFCSACVRCPGADVVPCVASDLSRRVSVGGGFVAELTGTVVAPAPQCVVGFGGTRKVFAGSDVVPCVASDLCGYFSFNSSVDELTRFISLGRSSVAELTVVVVAPAPQCVVGFCSACVRCPGADLVPRVASDLCWGGALGGGSVAELTERVVAPAPECSVGFGCARATRGEPTRAGADILPDRTRHLGWGVSTGGGSVAELTGTVVTPAPQCVVRFDGTIVKGSCADDVPCAVSNLCWAGAVNVRAVPNLTPTSKIVGAPTPECEIKFQCAIMRTSATNDLPVG